MFVCFNLRRKCQHTQLQLQQQGNPALFAWHGGYHAPWISGDLTEKRKENNTTKTKEKKQQLNSRLHIHRVEDSPVQATVCNNCIITVTTITVSLFLLYIIRSKLHSSLQQNYRVGHCMLWSIQYEGGKQTVMGIMMLQYLYQTFFPQACQSHTPSFDSLLAALDAAVTDCFMCLL